MLVLLLSLSLVGGELSGPSVPAFLVANVPNSAGYKMVADDRVIAFAQTPQGRILFSPFGAFVAVPNGEESLAVFQVGFSPKHHKRGLQPLMGKATATRVHHFRGSGQAWQNDLRVMTDLRYADVWPGIDLTFLTRGEHVEFQLTLAPGTNPATIALTTGAEHLQVRDDALVAVLDQAELRLSPPLAFQWVGGERVVVPVQYALHGEDAFGFTLGDYDPALPLIIDPVLSWSTFFGASGASSESERAVVVTVNAANEAVFAGETTTPDFPVTPGVFANQITGDRDLFVGKLSADGTTFQFLTLLGSSGDDRVYDIDLDDSQNIYITGEAREADFPTTPGAFDRVLNGDDAYITKLNAVGSALIFSTLLGGSASDEGDSLVVEPGGTVLALIEARSTDMPTTVGAADTTHNGSQDAYIARLSADGTQLLYGSYFGGSGSEDAADLLRSNDGRAVLLGATRSTDLPTTPGAFDETHNGSDDFYAAILSADGTTFSTVTYLGGTGADIPVDIGLDGSGNFILGGYSTSTDFPTTLGAFDESFNGDRDGVIAKLSADLSTLMAATWIGTSEREFIRAMAVDGSGQPVALGTTRSAAFPTTAGVVAETSGGGTDIFAAKFNTDLASLVFSTYLGGVESESPGGMALDTSGNIYGAGSTLSFDFPGTTSNINGDADALLFKLSSDGTSLIFVNLFGGGGGDFPNDMVRTPSGELIFVGQAGAANFPVTPGVFDGVIEKREAFVSKLNADGTTLLFSSFIGGSDNDSATAVALDSVGNILVGGQTLSADFPVTPGAFDTSLGMNEEMFIAKLTPNADTLVFATYLGGTGFQSLRDMAVAGDNTIYLTGHTDAADFPSTTGSFDETQNGSADAFVTKLAADASALVYSTFLGTTSFDQGVSIAVDNLGQAIVAGTTWDGFPTTAGAFDETHNGGIDAFVSKLNAAGSALIFSSYLGGVGGEVVLDMIVGADGRIHICGDTGTGFPTTTGAFQENFAGLNDAYVASFSADGTQLLYATYLGGSSVDRATRLAFDGDGNLVVAGETESTDFPTTAQAMQPILRGEQDAFISLFGCSGTQLQYSTYWGREEDENVEGLVDDGFGRVIMFGETESPLFATTPGVFDTTFSGTAELFLTEFDLRSENLAFPDQSTAVQGVNPIFLEVFFPACATDPLNVQWFNETESSSFPLNTNPVTLSPTPSQNLTMRADVTNTVTTDMASKQVLVLVSQNSDYFDLNNDGCNDLEDLGLALPQWLTEVVGDPNGDGFMDMRDFLYINTSGDGCAPPKR